jgi:hypothetical protein
MILPGPVQRFFKDFPPLTGAIATGECWVNPCWHGRLGAIASEMLIAPNTICTEGAIAVLPARQPFD